MKKRISFTTQGERANIDEYFIQRILPNKYTDAIGPFIFLEHLLLSNFLTEEPFKRINKSGVYPARDVNVLTYILNGEIENAINTDDQVLMRHGKSGWVKAGSYTIPVNEVI